MRFHFACHREHEGDPRVGGAGNRLREGSRKGKRLREVTVCSKKKARKRDKLRGAKDMLRREIVPMIC